jgi:hypothetical protein
VETLSYFIRSIKNKEKQRKWIDKKKEIEALRNCLAIGLDSWCEQYFTSVQELFSL